MLCNINLYLIRHGETIANRDGIRQGHSDFPLTDKGKETLIEIGGYLQALKFHKVYSSDLKRAKDSADLLLQGFSNKMDLPISYCSELREICYGVREGLAKEITKEEACKIRANSLGIDIADVIDTAESLEQLYNRQRVFLESINEYGMFLASPEMADCINVMVVTHGGFIREFLNNFCVIPTHLNSKRIGNGCVTVIPVVCKHSSAMPDILPVVQVNVKPNELRTLIEQ